ncbi:MULTISPECIES: non-homologous end joining protein Ku [unclassified Streptomyces]|uniref:non-homologous end joining protein Ku n=1 Tax=unclassified Streptomyces TaxID=2593676 RepID=UPI0022B6FC56|nr:MULTISPECIES: Ku protein [unclassified Streptomyces]MCZ7416385.1 Ku protein [Streptomyces sp. WMMC897]MCZ7433805.1 Ku protein [Streptomyces sp. WMMC1477]
MRSIWKGSISFGLVSIPIQLYGATQSHTVAFHQVHTAEGCGGRIRYRKFCELEEVEVPPEEIGKGYRTADGDTVLLTDEDLASLPLPTARTIDILSFVPLDDIDPIQLDRAYYLSAETAAAGKPYVLLREALKRSGKAAVAKFALRGRESLGLLRSVDDTLVLHSMLWPDEVRSSGGLAPAADVTVRDAELDMAETLMDSLGELDWGELHDDYRAAVEELVEAKQEGREPAEVVPEPRGRVIDLMAALESSVAAAREARGGEPEGAGTVTELRREEEKPRKRAAKKAAAKKPPPRKRAERQTASGETPPRKAAKKQPAKKTAARKTTRKRAS